MKFRIKKILDSSKKIVENMKQKLKNNHSFIYIFMSAFIILGYGFFFNSNTFIKNENKKSYTTPITETRTLGDYDIQVRSRKYSPTSSTVEFYVYCETRLNFKESKLQFELREQQNPLEVIETNVRRLDENNYIVRAKVNSNWNVLSLGVGEFVEENILDELENAKQKQEQAIQEQSQNISTELVKFYVERDDIESVINLKEKTANEYLSEGVEIEINILNEKINGENKSIDEKNNNIKTLEENIKKLKEEQVYQTEIEIKDSENKIISIQDAIKTLNSEIENSNKNIEVLKEKIQKLQEKKADYLKK